MRIKTVIVCTICCVLIAMALLGGCGGSETEPATPGNAIFAESTASAGNAQESAGDDEALKALEITANDFIKAFFANDTERMQAFLTEPYDWTVCGYEGSASAVCDTKLKGLDAVIGDSCTLSYEFRADSNSDTYQYLTMEFVKAADGWKVSFYGMEG